MSAMESTRKAQVGLVEFFTDDHRDCDDRWAEVEQAVDLGDKEKVLVSWRKFNRLVQHHLAMEEEVLFPAFEEKTGMRDHGPSFVMRAEHDQMRGILRQMEASAERADFRELLDHGDGLMMLIQQHNAKEEGMLYPMASQVLGEAVWETLRARMDRM